MELVGDTTRPLEARLAGVSALGELRDISATERLVALLGNETQQVRTVATTCLAALCRQGDTATAQALAMSIDGTFLSPDRAVVAHEAEDGPDLAMSKVDETSRGYLHISRDGDIIESDPEEVSNDIQSTLNSIQRAAAPVEEDILAEDTPEQSAPKRRHRRPFEGPAAIADDLRVVAVSIAGDVPDPAIEAAVLEAAESDDDALRLAAYRALLKRADAGLFNAETAAKTNAGLSDENPAIRSTAANILALTPNTSIALSDCLEDPDALVRAVAVRHCATDEQTLAALSDATLIVREAALEKILAAQTDDLETAAFDALTRAERIDTLADACCRSETVMTRSIQALAKAELTPKQAHVVLEALARYSPKKLKNHVGA